jgi:hypothetical protein
MTTRYFFDIDTGSGVYADTTGTELDDTSHASVEAIAILQEIARDEHKDSANKSLVATARTEAGPSFFRATLTVRGEWLE